MTPLTTLEASTQPALCAGPRSRATTSFRVAHSSKGLPPPVSSGVTPSRLLCEPTENDLHRRRGLRVDLARFVVD